jgi:CheY-like chemotaxis protein
VTPKLLLADDSVTIQRVIELTFADEDVQVLAVGDGRQAIERVQTDRPDIVLADIGMPERDGYEVAAFIKADPQLAHIPVLLLTGAFEPVDEVRARAVGCDGVLVKPFEPQMVISRVRDLLAGIRTTDAPAAPMPYPSAPYHATSPDERAQPASEPPGAALEDYFDRLDAALASKTVPPPPQYAELTPMPLTSGPRPASPPPPVMRSMPDATVPSPAPMVPPAASRAAARPRTSVPDDAAAAARDVSAWDPAAFDVPSEPPPPARVAEVQVPPPAPAAPAPPAPTPTPTLQEAFAALLAAETNQPVTAPPPPVDPDSTVLIDEIARRVIARLGDDSMRAAVLDAAERLVREEIARIKSQR